MQSKYPSLCQIGMGELDPFLKGNIMALLQGWPNRLHLAFGYHRIPFIYRRMHLGHSFQQSSIWYRVLLGDRGLAIQTTSDVQCSFQSSLLVAGDSWDLPLHSSVSSAQSAQSPLETSPPVWMCWKGGLRIEERNRQEPRVESGGRPVNTVTALNFILQHFYTQRLSYCDTRNKQVWLLP